MAREFAKFQVPVYGFKEILINEEMNVYVTKTPEGYVVDVYNIRDEHIDSITIWEDDLE